MAPLVLAVGGGKGGTGKSLLAVQLGIMLAEDGRTVVLVDADPHGGNLHTFFGLEDPSFDVDGLLKVGARASEVVLPTGVKRLGLIAGSRQEMQPRHQPEYLLEAGQSLALKDSDADVVIWDVGSGSSMWSTYLFEEADAAIWVVQPEPTCIEKEYHFLRHVCRWRLAPLLEPEEVPPAGWLPVPWLSSIKRNDAPRARALQEQLRLRPFLLLANQIRTPEERELAEEMMSACRRFFGIRGESLGWLSFDERVWLSVRQRRPVFYEYPESRWVEQLQHIFLSLLPHLEHAE